jgi:hypothetical protein
MLPTPPTGIRCWGPLLALVLASAVAAPAAARTLTLSVTPDLPTWEDRILLSVSGVVTTACGPSIVHLDNLSKPSGLSTQPVVEVDLVEEPCLLPTLPTTVPFTAEIDLGHVVPGNVTLIVHDVADGGVAQRELLVQGVSSLGLEGPRTPAVEGQPVTVALTYYFDCSSITPTVSGNVITLTYTTGCEILPPTPHLTRTEVNVGPLAAGEYEVRLVEPFGTPVGSSLRRLRFRVWPSAGCVPFDDRLCLHDGRFRVAATWRAFDGSTGIAHAAPLPGNEASGLMWFFGPENAELTVKVLDACGVDGDWWVFVASSSTVEYTLTVTDTDNGATRRYENALGQVPELISDTDAFDCP